MGSASDASIMEAARQTLREFGVPCEFTIVSAHRTPERLYAYAQKAASRGLKVIIAGAGGAAHLPGMIASITTLPVIGVPIHNPQSLAGIDSLLSIVQMPRGIPVATVAINNATNAALLAIRILSLNDPALQEKLQAYQQRLREEALTPLQNPEHSFDQPLL